MRWLMDQGKQIVQLLLFNFRNEDSSDCSFSQLTISLPESLQAHQQFYKYMINKFHKTTYNRQHNFNVLSTSQGKRTTLHQQPQSDWTNHQRIELPIESKIDFQSSLMFAHKNHSKAINKPIELNPRKTVNKSQAKFYQTSAGFTNARQRPQSKQEPRMKAQAEGNIKTEALQHERPQTSKGDRKYKGNISEVRERQTSQNEQRFPIQIKVTQKKPRTIQSSYSKRSSNPETHLPFNTSIDSQFLSLFAS